jgi:hypothetical protein
MVYSGISIPLSGPILDLWDMFPTVVSSRSYEVILPPLGFEKACNRRERDMDEAEARKALRNWKEVEVATRSRLLR